MPIQNLGSSTKSVYLGSGLTASLLIELQILVWTVLSEKSLGPNRTSNSIKLRGVYSEPPKSLQKSLWTFIMSGPRPGISWTV